MPSRTVFAFLASAAFVGSAALAQDAPPPPAPMSQRMHMNQEDMAKLHGQFCTGLYARAVGKMSELEIKLALTSQQKPLFERWKAVKLAGIKARTDKCATMHFPGRNASIMDGVKLKTAMLEARLADLKAETPSLEALVNSLDKDQQQTLKRAAMQVRHERQQFMQRMHGMRDRFRTNGMFRNDGATPPEPPQQ